VRELWGRNHRQNRGLNGESYAMGEASFRRAA
jgi:hypothetical protein